MSKLYFSGTSDARRTPFTSRGHKEIDGNFLFNFTDGQHAAGGVNVFMRHDGDTVKAFIRVIGDGQTKAHVATVTFNADGTFSIGGTK